MAAITFCGFDAQAARIEYTGSFNYLNFYGDGACPLLPSSVCGIGFEIEYESRFPKFDHSLGQLESVSLDTLFLFRVQAGYTVIESTAETPPQVGGAHNGVFDSRQATECIEVSVGSTCSIDYGVFSQRYIDVSTGEGEFQDGGTIWGDNGFRGGFSTHWTLGEGGDDDLDLTFLEGTGVSIAYTYTPVPEPGTALLLGFGLVGLGSVRRQGNQVADKQRIQI